MKVVVFELHRTKIERLSRTRHITRIAIRNSALTQKIDARRCFSRGHTLKHMCDVLIRGLEVWLEERVNSEFSAALLGFNGEAVVYCNGISDSLGHEYAMEYARMLQNRAKGIEGQIPRIPAGLFEPNRNLIRSTLDRMWQKHFPH